MSRHPVSSVPPAPGGPSTLLATPVAPRRRSLPDDGPDYARIMGLFTGKYTHDLVGRQVTTVERVARHYSNGVRICDLENFRRLVEMCGQRVQEAQRAFVPALCSLIRPLAHPFVKEAAGDELRGEEDVIALYRTLRSLLLSCHNVRVLLVVIETLVGMAMNSYEHFPESFPNPAAGSDACSSLAPDKIPPIGLEPWQAGHRAAFLARGGVAAGIVDLLRKTQQHPAKEEHEEEAQDVLPSVGKLACLTFLRMVSLNREIAQQIAQSGVLDVMTTFMKEDTQEDLLLGSVEVIWNVLELVPDAVMGWGSLETVEALQTAFVSTALNGFRLQDKELRNEILLIASILTLHTDQRPFFIDCGFLDALLLLCFALESQSKVKFTRHAHTTTQLDFELKRLGWSVISSLVSEPECPGKIVKHDVIRILLSYLNPDGDPIVRQWPSNLLASLQVQALSALYQIAPRLPEAFGAAKGPSIVLSFLRSVRDDVLRSSALRLVSRVVRLLDFTRQLWKESTIPLMLTFLGNSSSTMQRDAAVILADLCYESRERQLSFQAEGGIEKLIECIQSSVRSGNIHGDTLSLLFAIIGCLWTSIVGCPENEKHLLQRDGVCTLLNLLDVCPMELWSQTVGCLADLMYNAVAVPSFLEWKSIQTRRNAVQLLIYLWRQEEQRLNVAEDDGILKNLERPLSGRGRGGQDTPATSKFVAKLRTQVQRGQLATDTSPEVVSPPPLLYSRDIRSGIFAIFSIVGFPVIKEVEMKYDDQQKLCLIENFLVFREGEIWTDMAKELEEENVRPVSPDQQRVNTFIRASYKAALGVQQRQEQTMTEMIAKENTKLERFLENVKYQKEQEAVSTVQAMRKRTLMQARLEAKHWREQMLEKASSKSSPWAVQAQLEDLRLRHSTTNRAPHRIHAVSRRGSSSRLMTVEDQEEEEEEAKLEGDLQQSVLRLRAVSEAP